MENEQTKIEIYGLPTFVPNACSCRICGSPADRCGQIIKCRRNPGHVADTITGIFEDHSCPCETVK